MKKTIIPILSILILFNCKSQENTNDFNTDDNSLKKM